MAEEIEVAEEIEEIEVKEEAFVLTDELRKEALEKPTFKVLYIGDGDTRLSPFRGESMIRNVTTFYERQATIDYHTATSTFLGNLTLEDLKNYNIIWVDNISDFKGAKNLADLQDKLMDKIEPGWKEKLSEFKDDKEGAVAYVDKLNRQRAKQLQIVYCLDEFVWEGAVGRSHDIQTVMLMETFLSIADSIIVPTPELKEAILYYRFAQKSKDLYVIPSSVSVEFFPLFKNFTRKGKAEVASLREKPKVLIKGLSIPKNIEEFMLDNYKKMEITLCSVDEVNDHVMGLIGRKKINHIVHWANPYVNKGNIIPTYAIERDAGYDIVIHTKPDNMQGNMYEITTGDEDILFSISYGAVPICGIDHLGYDEGSKHLGLSSGKTFGKDTPAKKITKMVETLQTPVMFNEAFGKCRQLVEHRLANSPIILARYFSILLGKELSKARNELAKEKRAEIEQEEIEKGKAEMKAVNKLDDKPANVIEGDFKKV